MEDESTYNRLFILGGKGCEEDEWRAAFEPFGKIANIQVVTDRRTGDQKGICYITYEKISDAAKALEEMNGKFLAKYPKPLKVMIASSKREGNVKDSKEDEKILRLFIVCDKSATEEELKEHFVQFGECEYVRILRDRVTKESKGLAYVKYYRAYHAALAFEGCNQRYKPRFAELRGSNNRERDSGRQGGGGSNYGGPGSSHGSYMGDAGAGDYYSGGRRGEYPPGPGAALLPSRGGGYNSGAGAYGGGNQVYDSTPLSMVSGYGGGSSSGAPCRLEGMLPAGLSHDQLYKLFDIAPGFESLDYDRTSGMTYVKYQSSACGAYAKEKLNGFEYPPGNYLSLRFYEAGRMGDGDGIAGTVSDLTRSLSGFTGADVDGNLSTLVKSIQKATQVLEKAGLGQALSSGAVPMDTSAPGSPPPVGSGRERVRWCNVSLPYRQGMEPKDTPCEERLFIVSQPESFPDHVLVDLLCRFGGLIDAYFMPGKNYGYAKFSRLENAKDAQDTLHGQTICNMRLKVIHADPPKFDGDSNNSDKARKRPRTAQQ